MRFATRLAAVLLAALAIAGCRRVAEPEVLAQNQSAVGGPYVLIMGYDMGNVWGGGQVPKLYDLSKANGEMFWMGGGGGVVVSADSLDNAGHISGKTYSFELPDMECGANRNSSGSWVASASFTDKENGTSGKTSRLLNLREGSSTLLLLPKDKPRFAFVFCVLPGSVLTDNGAQTLWVPEKKDRTLFELAIDLKEGSALLGPKLVDLTHPANGRAVIALSGVQTGEVPPDTVIRATMCAPQGEGNEELAASGEAFLSGALGKAGMHLRAQEPFPIAYGGGKVLILPKYDNPRFLFIFSILPEVEPGRQWIP